MHARFGTVLVVLHVGLQATILVDGEDIAIAGVIVEGVSVDVVGGLFGGKDKYGSGVGVFFACHC